MRVERLHRVEIVTAPAGPVVRRRKAEWADKSESVSLGDWIVEWPTYFDDEQMVPGYILSDEEINDLDAPGALPWETAPASWTWWTPKRGRRRTYRTLGRAKRLAEFWEAHGCTTRIVQSDPITWPAIGGDHA